VRQLSSGCGVGNECAPGPFLPAPPAITDNNDGTYTVSYVIVKPGLYTHTATLYDADIAGTPFLIQVNQSGALSCCVWGWRDRKC
jgi:hypothetical protein